MFLSPFLLRVTFVVDRFFCPVTFCYSCGCELSKCLGWIRSAEIETHFESCRNQAASRRCAAESSSCKGMEGESCKEVLWTHHQNLF